jgi:hypothetical protein
MTKVEKKQKAGWIVALTLLCGAAVLIPSMISLGISLFEAMVALTS